MKVLRSPLLRSIISSRVINVTLAVLVFFSIVLNSFIPKEVGNKEIIIQAISAVAENFIVRTVKICTEDLMAISNKVAEDLRLFLRMTEKGATTPINNESRDSQTPANTASDTGMVLENRDLSEKVKVFFEETTPIIATGKVTEQLYKLYCNLKICGDVRNSVGILSFVLFILVIERRKFWGAVKVFAADAKIMKGKTNLC